MVKKISTSQMKQPFDRIETLEETGGTGEAGCIQVSNLDTAGPVRFWRIAATLYELTVGDSVEFGGL